MAFLWARPAYIQHDHEVLRKDKGPVGDCGVLGSMEELVGEHVQHVEARFTAAAKHQNRDVTVNEVS